MSVQTPMKPTVAPKKPRVKAAIPENETKQQALFRLAPGRVSRALKAIRALSFLKRYDMTPNQGQTILKALAEELTTVKNTFEGKSHAASEFKLPTE